MHLMLANVALYLLGWFIPALEPVTTWITRAEIYLLVYGFFFVAIPATVIYVIAGFCRSTR
jgi:hypothetical protein